MVVAVTIPKHMFKSGVLRLATIRTAHISLFIHDFLSSSPSGACGSVHTTSDNGFFMRSVELFVNFTQGINKSIMNVFIKSHIERNLRVISLRVKPFK
mmetsp:Transcript_51144/g.83912  ORF Transcript_51144/g.83912 Transcript_51144/m.83912 type:complete len:98 (+) Transcript_51144:1906-2199(+)